MTKGNQHHPKGETRRQHHPKKVGKAAPSNRRMEKQLPPLSQKEDGSTTGKEEEAKQHHPKGVRRGEAAPPEKTARRPNHPLGTSKTKRKGKVESLLNDATV